MTLLFLLGLVSLASVAHAGLGALNVPGGLPFIFNGAAVINHPNWTTQHPGNATLEGANFFCYATDKGYLSFGWWLKPSADTDYSHCKPDSPDYLWYEWTDKLYGCTSQSCKAHVVNYLVANNSQPSFATDYVFGVANLAPPELGSLSISYFDEKKGASAVATRHVLSSAASTASDCCKALKTLREVKKKYNIKLNFELVDICPPQKTMVDSSGHRGQVPLIGGCDDNEEIGHELR